MLVARRTAAPAADAPPAGGTQGRRPSTRRAYAIAPAIALLMLTSTLVAGRHYGIDLRDPDGILGSRLLLLWALVVMFWALDVVPRAVLAARRGERPVGAEVRAVARSRWSWRRVGIVLGSILAFYVTYLCYRNVKSYLPLARPELFDPQLLRFERSVFGGDPATFLHHVLGTGIAAHLLSSVYLLFLTFIPVSLGYALVWSTDTAGGMWWVSALSLNWVLGALSYFLIPSLGPAFAAPELFSALPNTGASVLQQSLLEHREEFLRSPVGSGQLQSIAAFASLHVAIVFTGALVAHLLRLARPLRVGLWIFLGLTVLATIYFGWHYVVDDVVGALIGVTAVYVGARLTGWRIERAASEPPPVELRVG
jgi:membrane-associated phospholipid phosphatase